MRGRVSAMADTIVHRGPDSSGTWVDPAAGIALGHRRLAVIDLSPAGHQPMVSADDRCVIVYNGEVYNFVELRAELEARGRRFRGRSDTEVIVEACCEWGLEDTVRRLIGMFAFALWDRQERTLHLVRDRLGIKPLYWGRFGDLVLFGSELKALRAHPGWQPEVDRSALSTFLRHNYIPAPHSIYRGVSKLEPGHILTLRDGRSPQAKAYWAMKTVARRGLARRRPLAAGEAIERLDDLLRDAVRCRMVADVPLGAFLSGGIDSSTVVALMQAQSSLPVRTFSIGFRAAGYDEARHARKVAGHLGTEHTELYVEPEHALEVIPELAASFDEPFSDSSQIPTCLVAQLTRRHVTVSLSGDGGDELFGGYTRYSQGSFLNLYYRLPKPVRRTIAGLLGAVRPDLWQPLLRLLPQGWRPQENAAELLLRLARADAGGALYRVFLTHWPEPERLTGAPEHKGPLWDPRLPEWLPDFRDRMQYLDTITFLPDDILTKVDRASMAVSLEARVPILDHRVVELAWRLPSSLKTRDGESKWLLRQVLDRYVPRALIDRPKMGFGAPIDAWLRGPLRNWAEELLCAQRLQQDGYLDPAPIRAKWREHLSGRMNWQYQLWDILMFQAWRERWL